jgi:hypothetical protein
MGGSGRASYEAVPEQRCDTHCTTQDQALVSTLCLATSRHQPLEPFIMKKRPCNIVVLERATPNPCTV